MKPLLIITGTGTEIGKTAIAEALLLAWGRRARVAGLKPIESGVVERPEDGTRLEHASTFHVTRSTSPYLFGPPVSPHLAARLAGREIDPPLIASWLAMIREQADGVVLELAGGLFSPVSDTLTNAELALHLAPTHVVLVAPDRLGVLHDVIATTRAARATGLAVSGIVLSAPALADASTGTNAAELSRLLPNGPPILASVARAPAAALAEAVNPVLTALGL